MDAVLNQHIKFGDLPYALQQGIFEKLNYFEYSVFEACSSKSLQFSLASPTKSFPHKKDKILIGAVMVIDMYHQILFRMADPPRVRLEVERLYILHHLTAEVLEFILYHIPIAVELHFENIIRFCPMFFQLLEKYSPRTIYIDVHSLEDTRFEEIDEHFSKIERVFVFHAVNLSAKECFSIKAAGSVIITKARLTENDIMEQVEDWKNDKKSFLVWFFFDKVDNVSAELLKQRMADQGLILSDKRADTWMAFRNNDPNIVLIVELKTTEENNIRIRIQELRRAAV